MSVTTVTPSSQDIWEELRQETMRNSEKTSSAAEGREASAADSQALKRDEMVALIKRAKAARKQTASPESATAGGEAAPVSTALENIGPNTYERLKASADRTYLTQAANFSDAGETAPVLHKSA